MVAQIERLDSVHKTVRLPRDDDFDEMLGMSGGYEHAAVFHDARLTCPGQSIDCGAVLEVWGDSDDARFRAGYIQELETGMEFLGTEHVFVNDHMVLRVSGDLSRSQADEYNTAFTN